MMPQRANLHIALTFLQFCYAGNHIFLRIALDGGVSKLIFPVYRNITALVLLAPLAYFSEKKDRPSITTYCVVHFFLLGLVGITMKEGFYLLGLEKTSPTFAAAMQNSVPALTFLMAALLRYESVHFNRIDGVAKVLGVLASVGGATIITLYKGPVIYSPRLAFHQEQYLSMMGDTPGKDWNLGGIYLFGHSLCWSGWIVMQAFVLKKYSAPLTVSAFTCFFGVVQFLTLAAFFEKDSKAWIFSSSGEIYSVLFSGVVTSGLASAIQIWTIGKGGPVLASIYLPLQTLLVAVMASIIFGEEFFLGGALKFELDYHGLNSTIKESNKVDLLNDDKIIGAFLIIFGLYLVVWGRSQETKTMKEVIVPIDSKNHWEERSEAFSLNQPLITAQSS